MQSLLQETLSNGKTRCNVCAFRCELSPGQTGVCRVRRNDEGTIRYLAYDSMGAVCPFVGHCGAGSYCVSKPSCNWSCSFCLAADTTLPDMQEAIEGDVAIPLTEDGFLDKKSLRGHKLTVLPLDKFRTKDPREVVDDWKASGLGHLGVRTSEPSIHLEAMRDIFEGVKSAGGKVVIGTNGYWTPETVAILGPLVDVAEVGFKASGNRTFLRKVSGVPKVEPIYETVVGLVSHGCEVLISDVPVWHRDFESDLDALCAFVAKEVPQRDYPRLSLTAWQGAIPAVAFGHFKPGIPWRVGDPNNFVDSRAGLLLAATELALRHLDSVWLQGLGSMAAFEREALANHLPQPWAYEGHAIRAVRSQGDLSRLLDLENAEPAGDVLTERLMAEWGDGITRTEAEQFLETHNL